MASDLIVTDFLVIPGDELSVTAVRSSGPGGQNVNKVSTKIEMRFDLLRGRNFDVHAVWRIVSGGHGHCAGDHAGAAAGKHDPVDEQQSAVILERADLVGEHRARQPAQDLRGGLTTGAFALDEVGEPLLAEELPSSRRASTTPSV